VTVAAVLLQQEGQAGKTNRLYVEVIPGPMLCVPTEPGEGELAAVSAEQLSEEVQVHHEHEH
jgi:hypothetical protein